MYAKSDEYQSRMTIGKILRVLKENILSITRNHTWIEHGLELMVSMNKVYEERTWQQIKENAVGFRYRSELERRFLELPKELQVKVVSKLWNTRQNGMGVLDQIASQHQRIHYEQENLLYNLYFEKIMVPRYGGIREI